MLVQPIVATGNTSGSASLIRYSTALRSALWKTADATAAYSIDMGSCSKTGVYLAGRKNGGLVIRKVNAADGTQEWEKIIAPVGANQYYVPMDQAFNPRRNQYTIAGYIGDTTAITPAQAAFYMTFDTNGNVLNQWVQAGDYKLDNVLDVDDIAGAPSVTRELALIKIAADRHNRSAIFELAEVFRARIVDLTAESLMIEMTGVESKIEGLVQVLIDSEHEILEICRSGKMTMRRGHHTSRVLKALGSDDTEQDSEQVTADSE